jgi:hypothetical protein
MSKATDLITPEQMTSDQLACYQMLCDLVGGAHHIGAPIHALGDGIRVDVEFSSYLATYDYNMLTQAVIMAHDRAIRLQIAPGGPHRVGLIFHRRQREGSTSQRHPTIEEAIATIRRSRPSA